MVRVAGSLGFVVASILLAGDTAAEHRLDYAIGADVSFIDHAVLLGGRFADRESDLEGLELIRHRGFNWVRLRLFVSPQELPNDLAYTTRLAVRAKQLGFKLLLDFHYSDTWADPGKQYKPTAWEDLKLNGLCERVRAHTRDAIDELSEAGAAPDMVQIGNEVIHGMLWPTGRLPDNWEAFSRLVRAGIQGVHDADCIKPPLVMIHIDRGGDWPATESFFDNCIEHGIEFDVIGQSFYPWWHGSLGDLRDNLHRTASKYDKDIVVVEAAYYWRKGVYPQEEGPFPETPEGQRAFLTAVDRIVREVPDGRGKGVFWWEPAVEPGPIYGRGLFDESGMALPALSVFANPMEH